MTAMNQENEGIRLTPAQKKARRARNVAIAILLALLVVSTGVALSMRRLAHAAIG